MVHVDQVIDRDIPSIAKIRKPDSFRRLVNQIAVRTANELNISSLSRDLIMSRETIEYYLQLMRKLSLVIEFDAWATGEHRRDIKNSKYHFVDSGIQCALRRFTDQSFEIGGSPTAIGSVFESYVANDILRFLPFLD